MSGGNRSAESSPRSDGRGHGDIRAVEVTENFVEGAAGSVLYRCGGTRVICVASIISGTPGWLTEDEGWLTAEYSLLPYSTTPRAPRARPDGKVDGRAQEIQRLIGRSLRASVDRRRFPGYTIQIDCDVLTADGGTRTAAITGAGLALARAVEAAVADGRFAEDPRVARVVAISAGFVDGNALLDLDYGEDSRAEIDLNVVGTGAGDLVEIQGSSESTPIAADRWQELTQLAAHGLRQVGEVTEEWT